MGAPFDGTLRELVKLTGIPLAPLRSASQVGEHRQRRDVRRSPQDLNSWT
jgi:hypothetical protein